MTETVQKNTKDPNATNTNWTNKKPLPNKETDNIRTPWWYHIQIKGKTHSSNSKWRSQTRKYQFCCHKQLWSDASPQHLRKWSAYNFSNDNLGWDHKIQANDHNRIRIAKRVSSSEETRSNQTRSHRIKDQQLRHIGLVTKIKQKIRRKSY